MVVLGLCCCMGFLKLQRARTALWLWCAYFPLQWPLLLQSTGSRVQVSVVAAHGLNSCGAQA